MENKKVIVVGGTGSLGRVLIRELLIRGASKVKVYARNELQIINLQTEFPQPEVETVIGDIRDRSALLKACKGCDILFHLAALKHVSICERSPMEAVETNVFGTQNVIDCAMDAGIERVVNVSTDKAINANCTYGCTKLLGEKLVLSANGQNGKTRFIVFRSGNLVESTGSVIPLFKKQIEQKGAVDLTDDRMNRFFIPIDRAARLLARAALCGRGGEIFMPVMPALRIIDIARYLLAKRGLDTGAINIIGVRPGEKLNEQLLCEDELERLYPLDDEMYVVYPKEEPAKAAAEKSRGYQYRSEKAVLAYEQAENFLSMARV